MRPRTDQLDPQEVLAALDGGCLAALTNICAALSIPRDRWHRIAPLRVLFEALAVACLADRDTRGTRAQAIADAGLDLGLNPRSHAKLLAGWHYAAWAGESDKVA